MEFQFRTLFEGRGVVSGLKSLSGMEPFVHAETARIPANLPSLCQNRVDSSPPFKQTNYFRYTMLITTIEADCAQIISD